MNITTISLIVLFLTMLISLCYYFRRALILRNLKDSETIGPAIQLVIAATLIIIGSEGILHQTTNNLLRTISPLLLWYSLMLSYFANKWLFDEKKQQIITTPLFKIITLCGITSMLFDILRGNNTNSYLLGMPYDRTALYYLHHILAFSVSTYLEIKLFWLFWNDAKRSDEFTYSLRRKTGAVSWLVSAAGSVAIEYSLIYSIIFDDTYRETSSTLLKLSINATGILLLSNIIPQNYFNIIAYPAIVIHNKRQKKEIEDKIYLHAKYKQIIKSMQHRPNELSDKRIDIEIEQARYLLWTQTRLPRDKPITAKDEAEQIFYYIINGKQIEEVGESIPRPTKLKTNKHNALVAKHLKQLEKRNKLCQQPTKI